MAVAIQADGKIVAAGETFTGGGDFPLARYTTTGDLDGSFGHGGRVLNALSTSGDHAARGLTVQADGKIVAAGGNAYAEDSEFVVARYTPSGALDRSFGTGGRVLIRLPRIGARFARSRAAAGV
jgi:uncharacterized delta-60 repeat protein